MMRMHPKFRAFAQVTVTSKVMSPIRPKSWMLAIWVRELTDLERAELDFFEPIEHLMTLLKAHAHPLSII